MKKKYVKYIVLLITLLAIVLLLSWLYVRGGEIDGIGDISASCTVTVETYQHLEYEDRVEYTLDADQTLALKELILDGRFTRVFSSIVVFEDQDMYDIRIDFNNGQNFITIHCIGNEYINITNDTDQFGGKHLKIRSADFEENLRAILRGEIG